MKKTIKRLAVIVMSVLLVAMPSLTLTASAATLIWPVPGHKSLSSRFGDYYNGEYHNGIDINDGSIDGATVVAAIGGTVTKIYPCTQQHHGSMGDCSGFGTGIIIRGDDGRWYQYAHMQAGSIPSNVNYVGAYVSAGQQVGRVGTTGNSSGPHLHFEINTIDAWNGHVDPMNDTYIDGYTSPPSKPQVTIDNTCLAVNQKASVNWNSCAGATWYWVSCWSKTEQVISQEAFNCNSEISFSEAGKYWLMVTSGNSLGQVISDSIEITVYDKPTAEISTDKSIYILNENININMKGLNNGTYTLGVWCGSKRVVSYHGNNNEYILCASEPGKYRAFCTAYGAGQIVDSNEITFEVLGVYSINYVVNNVSWKLDENEAGESTEIITELPVYEGYVLKEWNTNADGTGVSYQPGDTYSENADLTLYAIWELDHEHEYISEITQQPTCTEKGIKTFTCSVCNDVYYEDIDELGHDYVACVTEPTCTTQGFTTYECSRCGDTYTENYIDPLNHSSSSWHTAINPTATSEGLAEKRCDYCDTVLDQFTIPCLAPDYVTGITLSSEKETVKIGDTFTLTATVIPDTAKNKNVIWSSRNPEIVSVDNGQVTAIKPGTTAIVAETEDGGYVDFCLVRVVSLVSFNGAVVDNEKNIIYGLSSNLTNVDDYLKTADKNMNITFSTATVGTGTFINVMDNGEVVDLYEAVIFGDVNGDGWYDGQDAVLVSCLANGMLTKDNVSEAVYMAADCNHDGVINELDVELLNEAGTLLVKVDQSMPEEVLLETSSEYIEYLSLIDQSPELEVEDDTDVPEADAEKEETTPEQNAEFDFFEMIMNFIRFIIEAIRSYIPALYK